VDLMAEKPKVYALSTCPYCKRTKRFLDDHKIVYDCVDVDLLDDSKQDEILEEIEKLTGRRSFPVVIIGKEIIVGHDEVKLRKALKL
jgi:glutaredoxin